MILIKLKQATQAYHEKIERELDILNTDVSLWKYSHLLQRFWGFYVPVETQIDHLYEQRCHPECCVKLTASKQAELFCGTSKLCDERNPASISCPIEEYAFL